MLIQVLLNIQKQQLILNFVHLHELVHLRQWVRGQLKYRSGRMLFNTQRVSEIPYHNQPHEIEAYALENSLYLDYMYDTTGNWYGDE